MSDHMLIRPRLTEFNGIDCAQSDLDFAIPFLDEDIPLYVDPFLLWKSPSMQDQALHTSLVNSFNNLGYLANSGKHDVARALLIGASECDEVGLGLSRNRMGKRLGVVKVDEVLSLFTGIDHYKKHGLTHFEEIQLYVAGISKDRISDICCTFLKSFLIDYTTQCCRHVGIATQQAVIENVYNYKKHALDQGVSAELPVHPQTKKPLLLVPRRWLRFSPWISFEDYFRDYCPQDEEFNKDQPPEPALVLRYNREHYGSVRSYIEAKERSQDDCHSDPLFKQVPILSAKRKLVELKGLQSGKGDGADRKYEAVATQLLATMFYPQLDFAAEQVRTESGALIRDLVFYNNRKVDFLEEIHADYGNRQLVFELKNVAAVERDHLNQLNRYLDSGLGSFGVLVTRHELKKPMFRNTIDLWSGQRKCIITLTDADFEQMVDLYESRQRSPLDVLKKKYIEFRRACPS